MGFFPSCPNHGLPMLLKNGPAGAYWYCPDNCAHTENFLGAARRVTAVNGRPVAMGAMSSKKTARHSYDKGGSKVEDAALREVAP